MEMINLENKEQVGGRVFFSGASRSLVEEDEIELVSVGVDIGSSTSHLLFSKITLERLDTRYVVVGRDVLYQSDILLTPYAENGDIDTDTLKAFIDQEYQRASISRSAVDTGALILTGVAVRRRNARAIGDLFSQEAGKFVSVSAGDRLEAMMAARGSGAVAASKEGRTILNVDVGGGTTKLSVCRDGDVVAMTAVEAGARLLSTDTGGRINRLEKFGACYGSELGLSLRLGDSIDETHKRQIAEEMASRVVSAIQGESIETWMRLPHLPRDLNFDGVVFSGGVSEYIYHQTDQDFDDLGPFLGMALARAIAEMDIPLLPQKGGIRATVIGASQYTVQISGSTIYLDPLDAVPQRNIATIRPLFDLTAGFLDSDTIFASVRDALARIDNEDGKTAVAVAINWGGSATYQRLEALMSGMISGLEPVLKRGYPLIVVSDGDVGGLLGMHVRENSQINNAVISIDGIELSEFDFIDIGAVILATGSVPVVVKSLVFPTE